MYGSNSGVTSINVDRGGGVCKGVRGIQKYRDSFVQSSVCACNLSKLGVVVVDKSKRVVRATCTFWRSGRRGWGSFVTCRNFDYSTVLPTKQNRKKHTTLEKKRRCK